MTTTLAVVIPAYKEGDRIDAVLRAIPKRIPDVDRIHVVVADDGSPDDTATLARAAGATVVRHVINLGAGAALRTGTEAAIKLGADIVVHMDADGQHPPADLPRLVAALRHGADAVTGVRSFRRPMPMLLIAGNFALSLVMRMLFSIDNPDTQCAYRGFWVRYWPVLKWKSPDYAFASEMLVRGRHMHWEYVTIPTIYLDRYKGTGIADGVRVFRKLLGWRLAMSP